MTDSLVYYLARESDLAASQGAPTYAGSREDGTDGFIHFSTAAQVRESARRHRAGEAGLVLLEVDAQALGADLRWEAARGGDLFPHLYGALPLSAIRRSAPLPLDASGVHQFPDWV